MKNYTPLQLIDWDTIKHVYNNPELPWSIHTPQKELVDKYLIDRWDGGRRFYSTAVLPNLSPSDPVPEDAASAKYMKNILEYTVSLFSKSRKRATWREDQPVILADKALHRLNWLDDLTEKEKTMNTTSYLCPEPLKFSAVGTKSCIAV